MPEQLQELVTVVLVVSILGGWLAVSLLVGLIVGPVLGAGDRRPRSRPPAGEPPNDSHEQIEVPLAS